MTHLHKIWLTLILFAWIPMCMRAQEPVAPAAENKAVADPDDKVVQDPKVIDRVAPKLPLNANPRQIYRCAVQVDIDENGAVRGSHIVRCSDAEFGRNYQKAISESKFAPAVTQSGKHVATSGLVLAVKIARADALQSEVRVRYSLLTPPGTQTDQPDADGVYPLTKSVTKPSLIQFSDRGYADIAYSLVGSSPCDLLLTIDAHGKAFHPTVLQCSSHSLEGVAVESVSHSMFTPGKLHGKPVPIRLQLHLEFDDFAH